MGSGLSMTSVNKIKELAELKEYSLALDIIDSQDLTKSLNPQFLRVCGEVFEKCGRVIDARKTLVHAHRLAPEAKRIMYDLMVLYLNLGYMELAEKYHEIYLYDAEPDNIETKKLKYMYDKAKGMDYTIIDDYIMGEYEHRLDYEWSYEVILLLLMQDLNDRAKALATEYLATYKNTDNANKIEKLIKGEETVRDAYYVFPRENVIDDDPEQESVRLEEDRQLQNDFARIHPVREELLSEENDEASDEDKEDSDIDSEVLSEDTENTIPEDNKKTGLLKKVFSRLRKSDGSDASGEDVFEESADNVEHEVSEETQEEKNDTSDNGDFYNSDSEVINSASDTDETEKETYETEILDMFNEDSSDRISISIDDEDDFENDFENDSDDEESGERDEVKTTPNVEVDESTNISDGENIFNDAVSEDEESADNIADDEEYVGDTADEDEEFVGKTTDEDEEFVGDITDEDEEFVGDITDEDGEFVGNASNEDEDFREEYDSVEEKVEIETVLDDMADKFETVDDSESAEITEEAIEADSIEETVVDDSDDAIYEEMVNSSESDYKELEDNDSSENSDDEEPILGSWKTVKQKLEYPVFKSTLFPEHNKNIKDVENDFDVIMNNAQEKLNENIKKEEQMLKEAEMLLASLGISMNGDSGSSISKTEDQSQTNEDVSKEKDKEVIEKKETSRDELKASLEIDSTKKDLLKKLKNYR